MLLHFARPRHARLDERRKILHPAGRDRRGHARLAVGRVIASRNPDYAVGDHVSGVLGVQEYAAPRGDGLMKVDTKVAPLPCVARVSSARPE